MYQTLEWPGGVHPISDIVHEGRSEVDGNKYAHILENHPRAKGIAAANLQHVLLAGEHLGDKLVTRQQKEKVARIIVPGLVAHQAKTRQASLLADVEATLVLG